MRMLKVNEADSLTSPYGHEGPGSGFRLGLGSPPFKPYLELMRLDKPTGTILVFWPFAWGLTMAAYTAHLPIEAYPSSLVKCLLGAFVVHSSACTINDRLDRELDASVERTKNRPLVKGKVSVWGATIFVLAQILVGTVLFATQNDIAFLTGLVQLTLFSIYPLLKRVTYWPQAWLGFAMNMGLGIAWAATTGSLDYPILGTMLAGTWGWTMLYGTIYACQDRKDDAKVGIGSTAILFGAWTRPLLAGCAISFVSMLAYAGVLNHQGPAYFLLSVGGTAAHLLWQFATLDLDVPASCWTTVQRNAHLGWIVWGGLMFDYISTVDVLNSLPLNKLGLQ